jgi:hypothetical protein
MREWRLSLEVRREHMRVEAISVGGSAILVIASVVVGASVKV